MSSNPDEDVTFVFWLLGPWETHATRTGLYRADLDSGALRISGPDPAVIPIARIKNAELGEMGSGRSSTWFVRILCVEEDGSRRLYPANPFQPGWRSLFTRSEAIALVEAIEFCRRRSGPHPHPNPYVRQALVDGKPHLADGKSAEVSPLVYFSFKWPRPREVIVGLILFVAFIAGMIYFTILVFGRGP